MHRQKNERPGVFAFPGRFPLLAAAADLGTAAAASLLYVLNLLPSGSGFQLPTHHKHPRPNGSAQLPAAA
jgi:hypothetical protein